MLIAFDKSNTGSPFAQHLDQDQLSQKDLCRLRTLIKDGPDPDTHTWNHHLESPGSICLTSCYTLLHTWNHQGQYVFNPATHLESPAYHHVHVSVGSYPGCHSEWKWEIGLWENGKKLEIFFLHNSFIPHYYINDNYLLNDNLKCLSLLRDNKKVTQVSFLTFHYIFNIKRWIHNVKTNLFYSIFNILFLLKTLLATSNIIWETFRTVSESF